MAPVSHNQRSAPAEDISTKGLTSDEARARLQKDGPNAMPDTSAHPLRNALAKFWAPVPWLLEASIVLEVVLHKYSRLRSSRDSSSLTQLWPIFRRVAPKLPSRLEIASRLECFRPARWRYGRPIPGAELVRGDLVKLSLGSVVAADVHLVGDRSCSISRCLPANPAH
jgi:H+-transporting ATPase